MLDPYYNSFLQEIDYREACYSCNYANSKRAGDIIIADFWGIEKEYPTFYDDKGVSAVIINNEKGNKIFESIKKNAMIIETDMEIVAKWNVNLVRPTIRKKQRDQVYRNMQVKDFNKIIKENLKFKKNLDDIIKKLIPKKIKKLIKKKI